MGDEVWYMARNNHGAIFHPEQYLENVCDTLGFNELIGHFFLGDHNHTVLASHADAGDASSFHCFESILCDGDVVVMILCILCSNFRLIHVPT